MNTKLNQLLNVLYDRLKQTQDNIACFEEDSPVDVMALEIGIATGLAIAIEELGFVVRGQV